MALQACYVFVVLWMSLWLAWSLVGSANYGYAWLYDIAGIDEHIARYAPMNKVKRNFHLLEKAEHVALFEQIVEQVHGDGDFAAIVYTQPSARTTPLLIQAEQVHLEDVRRLFQHLLVISLGMLLAWLAAGYGLSREPLPGTRQLLVSVGAFVGLCILVVALIGPKQVFYWFHEVVFPDDHQWFFYWEASLMSCMMKAPYLFGWIAAVIGILGLLFVWPLYRLGLAWPALVFNKSKLNESKNR